MPTFLGVIMSGLLVTLPVNQQKEIFVEKVENKVQIGAIAGNRNLEFGVKNILEEVLLEKEYGLNPNAPLKVKVDIIYLDVLTTKKNISVFHKNSEEVVIRMKGVLTQNGKKIKEVVVEEGSLSNALKKASVALITKLTE